MAENIEDVMKEIHMLFARCPVADKKMDYIIVPKKQIFALLERLNYAVYNVMEQYEATVTSREMAEKRQWEANEKMIQEANTSAEDIYAASIIYTDRMLVDIRNIIEKAKSDLYKEYETFSQIFDKQLENVEKDQLEIKDKLVRMSSSKKYLEIINYYNEKERRKEAAKEAAANAVREAKELKKAKEVKNINGVNAPYTETGMEQDFTGTFISEHINSNRAFERKDNEEVFNNYKEDDNREFSNYEEDDERIFNSYEENDDFIEKRENRPIRKVASVTDSMVADGKGLYNDEVKHVSYEVKVNPNYGNSELSSENLDAEYYNWVENGDSLDNENVDVFAASANEANKNYGYRPDKKRKYFEENDKKGILKIFKNKK